MQDNKKRKLVLPILLVIVFIMNLSALASTNNFMVSAVIPENQVDKNQTYFDLRLKPSESQTIQVEVKNPNSEPLTISANIYAGDTSRNGLIVYEASEKYDETLKYPITSFVKMRQTEIQVPAQANAIVDIDIQMPSEKIEGVILGGLVFKAELTSEKETEKESGVGLVNDYNYVIGLKITEDDKAVEPEFDLLSITSGLTNYRAGVTFELQNKAAIIVKGMKVDAQVFEKDSKEVFKELKLENVEMAPNSNGEFVIDWGTDALKSGKYHQKTTVEYDGKIWEWDDDFEITSTEAETSNSQAVNIEKNYTVFWIIGGIITLLLLLFLVFLLGRRRGKKEEETKVEKADREDR